AARSSTRSSSSGSVSSAMSVAPPVVPVIVGGNVVSVPDRGTRFVDIDSIEWPSKTGWYRIGSDHRRCTVVGPLGGGDPRRTTTVGSRFDPGSTGRPRRDYAPPPSGE